MLRIGSSERQQMPVDTRSRIKETVIWTSIVAVTAIDASPVIQQYASGFYAIAVVVASVTLSAILLPVLFNVQPRFPLRRYENRVLVAWIAFAGVAFAIMYPLANSGLLGPGSDRDDALNVGISLLLNGDYPYLQRTYFGNLLTPMPGALLLGIPFYMLGNAAFQNVFWMTVASVLLYRMLERFEWRALIVPLLFVANLGLWREYVVGGDGFANPLYVAIALVMSMAAIRGTLRFRYPTIFAGLFLGIAICSRPIYFTAIPLTFLFGMWGNVNRAIVLTLISSIVAGGLLALFYFLNPSAFSPFHVVDKLRQFQFLAYILPLVALLPFAVLLIHRPTQLDVIGLFVLSVGIMLLPGVIILFFSNGPRLLLVFLTPFIHMFLLSWARDTRMTAIRGPAEPWSL